MVSDDSLTETDDSYFDIYSTQKVTSTYNALLEKLKSAGNASQREIIVNDEDEETNQSEPEDTSTEASTLQEVSDEESECEIIAEIPVGSTYDDEHSSLRRSERLSKRPGSQSSNAEPCPVSKRRKRNKGKTIPEVIELSDDEVKNEELNPLDLSLEDELNHEVSVKVLWKSVTVKTFRLRRFQKFTKVFEYFMEEEKVPYEKILLKIRNIKITLNDTPDSLDLKVCDFIDGGVLSNSMVISKKPAPICKPSDDKNSLILKVQDKTKVVHKFSINKDENIKIIMMKYAEQTEIPLNKIKFYFDGELLKPGDTPSTLGMENDEIIDVKLVN